IRKMARDDLPQVCAIAFQAFANDELFNWLWPNSKNHPDDLRRYMIIRQRHRLVDVGTHGFVVLTEETDVDWTGKPEIAGYAFFEREGNDELGRKWRTDSIFNSMGNGLVVCLEIERYLLSWELWYEDKFLDRAADRARMIQYDKAIGEEAFFTLDINWRLDVLAVSPKYQRRGVGAMLLEHGQKIAASEDLPMVTEASMDGRALYMKLGFKILGTTKIEDSVDDVIMLWEPRHLEGSWLEEQGDGGVRFKTNPEKLEEVGSKLTP
ncbi:acyl-CoA N-acyltransferase, partial [Amniculicola lignicola CBS 123094]